MDIYAFSTWLGGAGLGVMALMGLGQHGHDSHGGHAGGAHHGGAHHGGGQHGGHAGGGHHGHGDAGHAHHAGDHGHGHDAHGWSALWTLMSPRVAFSFLLGFGATGLLARGPIGGVLLLVAALVGGLAFERLIVSPLWNFLFRFASAPAVTLESSVMDDALAASGFDSNGEGLVALEVDGQVVQVLGRLRAEDRALGVRVRAGDRLRVEDVDAERHRCTVSFVGR